MVGKEYTMMGVIALFAGLIGGALSSQLFVDESLPHGKIVRAEAFELVDKQGNIYAELKRSDRGAQLKLFDKLGSSIDLWVDHLSGTSTSGLSLVSPKGHFIKLKARDGEPVIDLHGAKDSSMRLCITKYGPQVLLFNEEGTVLWSAPETQKEGLIEKSEEKAIEEPIRQFRSSGPETQRKWPEMELLEESQEKTKEGTVKHFRLHQDENRAVEEKAIGDSLQKLDLYQSGSAPY
jgi:hypothetical protein